MSAHAIAHDLAVIKAMSAELADYLLSETLFWQMQAGSDFPKLSLGLLLLTCARLRAARSRFSPARQAEADEAETAAEAALQRWPVAAEKKAGQELRSRVNLWDQFLDNCREDSVQSEDYPGEVGQRAIAELLLQRFTRLADSAEARRLAALDAQLRAQFRPGEFIWPAELHTAFPRDRCWFLYGRL